jgi:DNA polymerase-1
LVTEHNFRPALEDIRSERVLVSDLETTGLEVLQGDRLCGIAVKRKGKAAPAWYFPFRHREGPNLPEEPHLRVLVDTLDKRTQVGYNYAKFDRHFLVKEGAREEATIRDVMNGAFLVDENKEKGGYVLEELGTGLLGRDCTLASEELNRKLRKLLLTKGDLWRLPPKEVEPYACEDVRTTDELDDVILNECADQGLMGVWAGVDLYGETIRRMHDRGVMLDRDLIREYSVECQRGMLDVALRARDLAGYPVRMTDQGFANWLGLDNADKYVLEGMKKDPRAKLIREFRDWKKALTSYYRVFERRHLNGVMHPNLSQTIVITGRLSCTKPNLQAIPRATDIYKVRNVLVARPGYVMVIADYATAEMRLSACYAREKAMARLLAGGLDVHQAVADTLGIPRDAAKRINFSVIYGIGPETLAHNLRIAERRAAAYLRRYHRQYPGFRRLYKRAERAARDRGYIVMWSGRRRHYPDPHGSTPSYKASDHLIQGGVGELLRERQARLDREVRPHDIHQLLAVHDSAVMEVPEDKVPLAVEAIRDVMEEREKFYPPLVVDVTFGPSLGQQEAA